MKEKTKEIILTTAVSALFPFAVDTPEVLGANAIPVNPEKIPNTIEKVIQKNVKNKIQLRLISKAIKKTAQTTKNNYVRETAYQVEELMNKKHIQKDIAILEEQVDIEPIDEATDKIKDFIASAVFIAMATKIFDINIYWTKIDIELKELIKKIIHRNDKENVEKINKLKKEIQTIEIPEKIRENRSEIALYIRKINNNQQNSQEIVGAALSSFLLLNNTAIESFATEIEKQTPYIVPAIESRPELLVEAILNNRSFKELQEEFNKRIRKTIGEGVKEAVLKEIEECPVTFKISEMDLFFKCKGENLNNIIVTAFKDPEEIILYSKDKNSKEVEIPEIGINLKKYPNILISNIFHMCRCYREHERLNDISYLQNYNDFRIETLKYWKEFINTTTKPMKNA